MFFKKKKPEPEVQEPKRAWPLPKHVALDLEGVAKWAEEQHVTLDEAYRRSFALVQELVQQQVAMNIPVMTFFVLSAGLRGTAQAAALLGQFAAFAKEPALSGLLRQHKVKVTFLGKWYDLPQAAVEAIRGMSEETKEYDSFFLNLCMNYDGQEEIVDACRLLGRQIKIGKLDPDLVSKKLLKENLASSYFIPPDVILRNCREAILSSLLLWDSAGARFVASRSNFPELTAERFAQLVRGE